MKLWQRYLLKESLALFSAFLFLFYLVYSLLDYSIHMQEIVKGEKMVSFSLACYYLSQLSKQLHLLLPLALLVTSIKVLSSLSRSHELLALQTGRISLRKISQPFFLMAFCCTLLVYANFEFFNPVALDYISFFEKTYFKKKKEHEKALPPLSSFPLEDGSILLYQRVDRERKELFDVFWIVSVDELWHMQKLLLSSPHPEGLFVDHLKRNIEGEIEKFASYPHFFFKGASVDLSITTHLEKSIENRSIRELFQLMKQDSPSKKKNLQEIETQLYFKWVAPLFAPLTLLAIFPFCVRFNKNCSLFLLFSLSIFGFIAFCSLLDGLVIFGETKILPPSLSLFSLPLLCFLFFGRAFIKMEDSR